MIRLRQSAVALIGLGLLPSIATLIGYTSSRLRDCEGMMLEGPAPCPVETALIASWLLNVVAWPLLAIGLLLGAIWLWRR